MDRPGLIDPDNPDNNIHVLLLEFIRVHSISITCGMEDADTGSNNTDHGSDRVERNRELFLEFRDDFCNRDRFDSDKEPEHFTPDSGPVPGEIRPEASLNDSFDLCWRSHAIKLISD